MKLIKINTDHYVVVDDSEIKEGDWIYNAEREPSILKCVGKGSLRGWQKITHSTDIDINELYYISLQEVKELIGEVDVEKKAIKDLESYFGSNLELTDRGRDWVEGYGIGYNQALEDNKEKKYTEEDLKRYHNIMCLHGNKKGEEFIQSLQPKTEWEVEFDNNGKLKLL